MTAAHPIFASILEFGVVIALIMLGLGAVSGIALSARHHRLFSSFRTKYPEIAQKEIPYVFDDSHQHPEKMIYLYRKKALPVLRLDPELWRLRRQVLILTILAFGLPVSAIVAGFVLGFIALRYGI